MSEFLIDSDSQIGSIHLKVSHLEQSLRFYESFLGFKTVKRDATTAYLSPDGQQSYLVALSQANSMDDSPKRAGLYHFAILLPERKDLACFLSHLLKHKDDVKIDGFSDHLVSESLYIRDPDNIGIEIYRDRNQSEWKWSENQVRMATIPLDAENLLSASNSSWKCFPDKTTIGHVHLHVSSLSHAKIFYSEIMGLKNTASIQGALFFAAGDYHHHIATNVWLGEKIPKASSDFPGLDYFTIKFSSKDKLDDAIKRLEFHKINVKESDGSFEITDEDKITIRLIQHAL